MVSHSEWNVKHNANSTFQNECFSHPSPLKPCSSTLRCWSKRWLTSFQNGLCTLLVHKGSKINLNSIILADLLIIRWHASSLRCRIPALHCPVVSAHCTRAILKRDVCQTSPSTHHTPRLAHHAPIIIIISVIAFLCCFPLSFCVMT